MSFYSYTNQTYNILKKEQVCIAFLYNTNLLLSQKLFFREQLFYDSKHKFPFAKVLFCPGFGLPSHNRHYLAAFLRRLTLGCL